MLASSVAAIQTTNAGTAFCVALDSSASFTREGNVMLYDFAVDDMKSKTVLFGGANWLLICFSENWNIGELQQ